MEEEDEELRREVEEGEASDAEESGIDIGADAASSDSDDEEPTDEEMTEADKQFIVDEDDEEEIGDAESRRRKKKKRKMEQIEEEDSGLSEDELELIQENYNDKNRKRLRQKVELEQSLAKRIFDDDSDNDERDRENDAVSPRRAESAIEKKKPQEYLESDVDDLDDFIIRDDEDEEAEFDTEARMLEKMRRRKERLDFKQNLGVGHGVDDDTWRDIMEIFGDGSDYSWAMEVTENYRYDQDEDGVDDDEMEPIAKQKKNISINDVYEPAEISTKMLTKEDELIRMKDVPERTQLLTPDFSAPSDETIIREAQQITREFLKKRGPSFSNLPPSDKTIFEKQVLQAIVSVLRFLLQEQMEVPFILNHRKDYFYNVIDPREIWWIYDQDQLFRVADQKKRSAAALVDKISKIEPSINDDHIKKALLQLESNSQDIADVLHYLQIAYPTELQKIQDDATAGQKLKFKRPAWKVAFDDSCKHGIPEFAKFFDINAVEFAQSLALHQPSHFPDDHPISPIDAAKDFVSARYPTPEAVIEASKLYLAHMLGSYPAVRIFMRTIYFNDAGVTVTPTEKGKKEITETHPYYPFKYLSNKPSYKFTEGQFLQLVDAENSGLVKIDIRVEMEDLLLKDLSRYLTNDYVNDTANLWNSCRRDVAEILARQILFPYAAKWLKEQLTVKAIGYITDYCQNELERRIDMTHFPVTDENAENEIPVVIAITCDNNDRNSPLSAVVINENGELGDYIQIDSTPNNRLNDVRQQELVGLEDFLIKNPADVVVIAGFKPHIKNVLMKQLQDLISTLKETNPPVLLIPDDVARIFMNSKSGKQEFPEKDYPSMVRYCVALGRYTQDPTMAYASLFNPGEDFRSIRFHPLQNLISEDQLKKCLERALLNLVSQTGVDINEAVQYPHRSHTLQFVSGLGPRKAQAIIAGIIRNGGKLLSREGLVQNKMCAKTIFMNCASFIRIIGAKLDNVDLETDIDVLDDTRIHPEDYNLARKMAADALDIDEIDDEGNPSQHVQELMDGQAKRLELLLLDDFAVELERQSHKPKRICLNDIKDELTDPYAERRRDFEPANQDESFVMLTGESEEGLRKEPNVSVSVVKVKDQNRFISCRLPSGVEGKLDFNNMDVDDEMMIREMYPTGSIIQCSVLGVDKERLVVELGARIAQLNPKPPIRDQFFDIDREHRDLEAVASKKITKKRQTRTIPHPFFLPLDYKQAEEHLNDKPRGEVVVRPSTKGNNHFSITWKVEDGVYQHLDVLELQKDNDWSLGKRLKIDELEFHEIDQIVVEFIEPMTRRINAVIEHPKFKRKFLQQMCSFIEDEAKTLKRSAYGFIINPQKPGSFTLVYQHPANSCKYETVIIKPSGYVFRNKTFNKVDDLLNFFKQNEADKMKAAKSQRYQLQTGQQRPQMPSHAIGSSGLFQGMNPERMERLPQSRPGRF